jgi:hypothetical protein
MGLRNMQEKLENLKFRLRAGKKWGVEYDDGFIFRGAFLHGACTLYITQNGSVNIF